jgi:hypothetical protein
MQGVSGFLRGLHWLQLFHTKYCIYFMGQLVDVKLAIQFLACHTKCMNDSYGCGALQPLKVD